MSDEWMVRVEGKEYGPVDEEELQEWRKEGRLIRSNEVRRVEDEKWIPAAESRRNLCRRSTSARAA